MDHRRDVDSAGLKTLLPGLAWVLGSWLIVLTVGSLEKDISRWSPGFLGSSWDLRLALCGAVGAVACVIVGLIRIGKASVAWYWRILTGVLGLALNPVRLMLVHLLL